MNFGSPFQSRRNSLDRYIPRRNSQDIEGAHYKLQRNSSASNHSGLSDNEDLSSYTVTEPPDSPFSPQMSNGLTPFWSRMNSLSLGSPKSRVLNFSENNDKCASPNGKESPRRESCGSFTQTRYLPSLPAMCLFIPSEVRQPLFDVQHMSWGAEGAMATSSDSAVFSLDVSDQTFRLINYSKTNRYDVTSLACDDSGVFIAFGTDQGIIKIWNNNSETFLSLKDGLSQRKTKKSPKGSVTSLAWSSDSSLLTGGTSNGYLHKMKIDKSSVLIEDIEICAGPHKSEKYFSGISCLSYSPVTTSLLVSASAITPMASGATDGTVCRYNHDNSNTLVVQVHTGKVTAVEWCPWKPSVLASCAKDGLINVWSSGFNMQPVKVQTNSQVVGLKWNTTTKEIVTAHNKDEHNSEVALWSYPRISKIASISSQTWRILAFCLHPDTNKIATSSSDNLIRFWDITRKEIPEKANKKKVLNTIPTVR